MRLEVIIDDDQPLFFEFNSKITIGSDPVCDIVIEHPEISRKHVSAYPEDDRFYIIDQGSRNGTYLNDERLIPGKKTEFTSFFPVRLGKSILVSLISDEEMTGPEKIEIPIPNSLKSTTRSQEATTLISLKDLHATKTESLVQKKTKSETKLKKTSAESAKKKTPVKKKKNLTGPQVIAILIAVSALGYHYYGREQIIENEPVNVTEKGPLKKPAKPMDEIKSQEINLVPTAGDTLISKSNEKGCETDFEKSLCSTIPHLRHLKAVEGGFDIIVEATPFQEEASKLLSEYSTKVTKPEYDPESKEVAMVMGAQFFLNHLTNFPAQDYPNKIITVGFIIKRGEIETLLVLAAYKTDTIPSLRILLTPQQLQEVKQGGPAGFDFTNRFYRVWNREKIPWEDKRPAVTPVTPISGTPEVSPPPVQPNIP